MTEITVTYERKFSDGNYGSEGVSFSVTIPGDNAMAQFQSTHDILRSFVLSALAKSAAPMVARVAARELNPQAARPTPAISDEAYFDAMADARSD